MVDTRLGGSVSEAKSHTITFQSFDEVNTYLELRLQLHARSQFNSLQNDFLLKEKRKVTHSTLVMPLTWPSSHRTVVRVSRSQIQAEPSGRPAAMKRPEGSNLAKDAWARKDVWTAVG